jgi:general secretion pathway protein G
MNLLRKLRNPKGFTLVELIIVIMIIGILAATMLPKVMGGPARARDAQRKANLAAITTALELYYTDNEAYPVVLTLGSTLDTYMANLPYEDPKDAAGTGYQYVYCFGDTAGLPGQDFALVTLLETGGGTVVHKIGTNTALVTDPTTTAIGTCATAGAGGGGKITF